LSLEIFMTQFPECFLHVSILPLPDISGKLPAFIYHLPVCSPYTRIATMFYYIASLHSLFIPDHHPFFHMHVSLVPFVTYSFPPFIPSSLPLSRLPHFLLSSFIPSLLLPPSFPTFQLPSTLFVSFPLSHTCTDRP